ncbi:MAG: efflux RND transporter permease subunit [Shewanella fodinae]|nr:efflux RND transporter permease subunit [Shewanella fodinae]
MVYTDNKEFAFVWPIAPDTACSAGSIILWGKRFVRLAAWRQSKYRSLAFSVSTAFWYFYSMTFLQPFTILSALPLSLGGAIIGLFVTHTDFTMSVIIGILMLMGVVTKTQFCLWNMQSQRNETTVYPVLMHWLMLVKKGQGRSL